jgi:hypothetical protein
MKNKKSLPLIAALLVFVLLPLVGAQKIGDQIGYRDTIVVSQGETRDNVVTFGSDVVIEGTVRKSVFAVGGTVTISGEVGDSVVCIGSRITLKSTAVIKRDLVILFAAPPEKEPGFRVDGDTVFFKGSDISAKFLDKGFIGFFSFAFLPIMLIFKLVNMFVWFLLAIVIASLFPKQMTFAASYVRTHFWSTLGTGLVAYVLFVFAVIVAAILCIILIGIPILLALAMAGLAIKIFGKVALFYFFGESLARSFRRQAVSPLGGALLGLLLVSLIGFIPILGFLFSSVISIIGWGAVLRTKFGTRENWFRRAAPVTAVPPPPPTP